MLTLVPCFILSENLDIILMVGYSLYLYKWFMLIKLGTMEANIIPYIGFMFVFYFGKKAFMFSHSYLVLLYTNQTFKEKHLRDGSNKEI